MSHARASDPHAVQSPLTPVCEGTMQNASCSHIDHLKIDPPRRRVRMLARRMLAGRNKAADNLPVQAPRLGPGAPWTGFAGQLRWDWLFSGVG